MGNFQKGVLALVLMNFFGASMGVFARYLHEGMSLFQQVGFRIFAGFLFSCLIFYKHIDLRKLQEIKLNQWALLILRGFAIYLIGISFGTVAYINGKYSNISFIMAFPMTAILGTLIFKDKLSVKKFLYILMAFLGVVLIVVRDFSQIFSWDKMSLYAILAVTFVSLGNLLRKWHTDLLNDKEISMFILFISTILLFITSVSMGERITNIKWTPLLILVVIGAGIFNALYSYLANYGFKHIDTLLANNILALQSIYGVLISWILYHENPSLKECIGGVLIILSIILLNNYSSINVGIVKQAERRNNL